MAADPTRYFVGPANTMLTIKAMAGVQISVGSGVFKTLSASLVEYDGEITQYASTKFDLSLKIDDDANCTITPYGDAQRATYVEAGNVLVVELSGRVEKGTIAINISQGGTAINPDIPGGRPLWIGPA